MTRYDEPLHLSPPGADALPADHVRLAASAYLARFTGSSREHTQSGLRCYLRWCADRGLDPLAARRSDLEHYILWMQETCRFKPSTISRRFSVAAGFYRTCVVDGVLEHSPAEHVRRPNVPAESPTLGFTHPQFEALLTAARESANDTTSPWWPCSGCWACGSSKPPAPASQTWAKNMVTFRVTGTAEAGRLARRARRSRPQLHDAPSPGVTPARRPAADRQARAPLPATHRCPHQYATHQPIERRAKQ